MSDLLDRLTGGAAPAGARPDRRRSAANPADAPATDFSDVLARTADRATRGRDDAVTSGSPDDAAMRSEPGRRAEVSTHDGRGETDASDGRDPRDIGPTAGRSASNASAETEPPSTAATAEPGLDGPPVETDTDHEAEAVSTADAGEALVAAAEPGSDTVATAAAAVTPDVGSETGSGAATVGLAPIVADDHAIAAADAVTTTVAVPPAAEPGGDTAMTDGSATAPSATGVVAAAGDPASPEAAPAEGEHDAATRPAIIAAGGDPGAETGDRPSGSTARTSPVGGTIPAGSDAPDVGETSAATPTADGVPTTPGEALAGRLADDVAGRQRIAGPQETSAGTATAAVTAATEADGVPAEPVPADAPVPERPGPVTTSIEVGATVDTSTDDVRPVTVASASSTSGDAATGETGAARATPATRLAEQQALREAFDQIERHRLTSSGTLELEIRTERFGALRIEAVDGGEGVQLSLSSDDAGQDELADLARELRERFGDDAVDVSSGDHEHDEQTRRAGRADIDATDDLAADAASAATSTDAVRPALDRIDVRL